MANKVKRTLYVALYAICNFTRALSIILLRLFYLRSRNEWIYYNDISVSVVPSSEINMSRFVEVICYISNAWL